MKMYVLSNGTLHMDKSWFGPESAARSGNSSAMLSKTIAAPVYAVLIDHPDGKVLFDTGCHPESMGPDGRWTASLQRDFPWVAEDDEYLHERLHELRIRTEEIRFVVASHLHCDHAGNVGLFPNATVLVHSQELKAAQAAFRSGVNQDEFVSADIAEWNAHHVLWKEISAGQRSLSLLPGFTVHNLGPGHSHGMLGLQVDLPDTGTVFLASDAAYSSWNYGSDYVTPKAVLQPSGYANGIAQIEQVVNQTGGQVWFGHDPEQFQTLRKSTEGWYE